MEFPIQLDYSCVRMVCCIYREVTGYNFQNIVFLSSNIILSKQTVQALMKFHVKTSLGIALTITIFDDFYSQGIFTYLFATVFN